MEKTLIEMKWKLNTTDLTLVDAMMKKMLGILSKEELDIIQDCKVSKTLIEVNVDAKE